MPIIKKLIFAPVFLTLITISIYFYKLILASYLNVFFSNYGGVYEFSLMAIPLVFASLAYCLFVTFTQDIKYAAALAVITALIPFAFLSINLSIVIGIGLIISLIFAYFNLQTNLRSYINFQASTLLMTPIKMLNTFLLLTLAVGFYLNSNSIIQTQGFKIPEPLINWTVDFMFSSKNFLYKGDKYYLAQTLTPEQTQLLKQNPALLKQYGITAEDLDALTTKPTSRAQLDSQPSAPGPAPLSSGLANIEKNVYKELISGLVDQIIKPYLFVIPILLAFMFYSLASLIMWVISLFLSPLISLIFLILEKTGFVKYEKEMREVKKIII